MTSDSRQCSVDPEHHESEVERLQADLESVVDEIVEALHARAESFASRRTRGAFHYAAEVVEELFG